MIDTLPTFPNILDELETLYIFNINSAQLIERIDIDPAYVTYDLSWRGNLTSIQDMLEPHSVTLTGR